MCRRVEAGDQRGQLASPISAPQRQAVHIGDRTVVGVDESQRGAVRFDEQHRRLRVTDCVADDLGQRGGG